MRKMMRGLALGVLMPLALAYGCTSESEVGEQTGSPDGSLFPTPESRCDDGLDDDGDGYVDEGCVCTPGDQAVCYGGDISTRNIGVCKDGAHDCLGSGEFGEWDGECHGDTLPGTETCNGLDDDCDGSVDEGCECSAVGESRACGGEQTLPLPCKQGTQVCQEDGIWSECEGAVLPAAEVCGDDIDNDCNGEVDDGCEEPDSGTGGSGGSGGSAPDGGSDADVPDSEPPPACLSECTPGSWVNVGAPTSLDTFSRHSMVACARESEVHVAVQDGTSVRYRILDWTGDMISESTLPISIRAKEERLGSLVCLPSSVVLAFIDDSAHTKLVAVDTSGNATAGPVDLPTTGTQNNSWTPRLARVGSELYGFWIEPSRTLSLRRFDASLNAIGSAVVLMEGVNEHMMEVAGRQDDAVLALFSDIESAYRLLVVDATGAKSAVPLAEPTSSEIKSTLHITMASHADESAICMETIGNQGYGEPYDMWCAIVDDSGNALSPYQNVSTPNLYSTAWAALASDDCGFFLGKFCRRTLTKTCTNYAEIGLGNATDGWNISGLPNPVEEASGASQSVQLVRWGTRMLLVDLRKDGQLQAIPFTCS